jgi:hypothetical protein
LESNQQLSARATEKIVLQSGFTAKAGCTFIAKIDPAACNSGKGMEDEEDFFTPEEETEIISKRTGQEETIMTDIRVYPNPTYDRIFIEIPYYYGKTMRYKIQMLNAQGKILQMIETEEYRIIMDMNNYPQGLYLLNITNIETGEVSNYKIVRQ